MSLRTRAILLLVGTTLATLLAFAAIARWVVVRGFSDIETADAAERLERISSALEADLDGRLGTAREIATASDTTELMRGERERLAVWREAPEMLDRLDIDGLVLVDPFGRVVHRIERDASPLPPALVAMLRDNTLRLPDTGRDDVRAVISTGDGLAVVVAHEIPGRELPLGVAITVREVDDAFLSRLVERSFVPMRLSPYAGRSGLVRSPFGPDGVAVTEDGDWVRATGNLVDGVGRYVIAMSAEVPRDISAAGRTASTRLFLLILASTLLTGTFILLWFERRILSRMARLTSLVTRSDATQRPRVSLDGDDELARLADRIERTLTSLETAQEELRDTNAELAIANELKDDFVSMVSHEFRTPLTSIRGYADTILRYGDDIDPAKRRAFTERIGVQSVALTHMVDDLLTLSQVRRGTVRHEPEHLAVRAVVSRLLDDLSPDDVEVTADHDVAVFADPEHVRRILTNLVDNAGKYGQGPITVSTRVAGEDVEVRVRDHGPGVDSAFVPALFDRFTQASVGLQRTAKGVGLGLSIVRTLAELNGGTVWYEDGDPGAVFVVRLPRGDIRATARPVSPVRVG